MDFQLIRISQSKLFAEHHNYINGIEYFWGQAKRFMREFNDFPKGQFRLSLVGCEWRVNNSVSSSQLYF